jgi:2-keto-4-pentenoate hydratase/2-oxohepta-3-ene-1,7-dioic acid hydratase in catechol pathway
VIPAYSVAMTGTPARVGAFQPQRFLRDNELVEIEISRLGVLRNKIGIFRLSPFLPFLCTSIDV